MIRRLLRQTVSVVLTLAVVFVAIPLSVVGAIALGGALVDTTARSDARLGLQLLGIAAIFWGALVAWFVLCGLVPMQWQFSIRMLLLITTLVAAVLGLIVWAH